MLHCTLHDIIKIAPESGTACCILHCTCQVIRNIGQDSGALECRRLRMVEMTAKCGWWACMHHMRAKVEDKGRLWWGNWKSARSENSEVKVHMIKCEGTLFVSACTHLKSTWRLKSEMIRQQGPFNRFKYCNDMSFKPLEAEHTDTASRVFTSQINGTSQVAFACIKWAGTTCFFFTPTRQQV